MITQKIFVYSPEFFAKQQLEEQERFEQARIPLPEFTFEKLMESYPTEKDRDYANRRLQEFLESMVKILHNRLQPGWAKVSNRVFLGQLPSSLFHHWFGYACKGKRTSRITKQKRNGLYYPVRRHGYRWPEGVLPRLNTNNKWFVNEHGNGNGHFAVNTESRYTAITVRIEDDTGRVYCGYRQTTEAIIGNTRYETA